jgi:inorganic phosphate transporter, PiT family
VDLLLVVVVAAALAFDFTNGFHDSANAIATTVTTRALPPRVAVAASALLNFAGAFLSLHVAATIGTGVVAPGSMTLRAVLAGLVAAIVWNVVTWYLALPTSSSHALIGGLVGAALVGHGADAVRWRGIVDKVAVPSLAAPLLGVPLAALALIGVLLVVRRRAPVPVNRTFRRLQLVSAGFVALTHGTNDAQKTMGVIALALVANDPGSRFHVPTWVVASAAGSMALGTYVGGWRIIRTLGQRIAHLDPPEGFAAESATALILWYTAHVGAPVSTTHTVSGAVLGAGAARRVSAVRWGVARDIVVAWLSTVPCAAAVGALVAGLMRVPGGAAVAVVAALAGAALALRRALPRAPDAAAVAR